MQIDTIDIKGFRNFYDASIRLHRNTLIIGYNDVGKTNLTYALRLLLDRFLPEAALEPRDSDFFVHERTNEISITLRLIDINEECIIARMRERRSDEGEMFLVYRGFRDPDSNRKSYKVLAGPDLESLTELSGRPYLKVLSMRFIEGRRDLTKYVRRERRALLDDAKRNRTEVEAESDTQVLTEIQEHLEAMSAAVTKLRYVQTATSTLNEELQRLSYRNEGHQIMFDTGATDTADFVNSLELVSEVKGRKLSVGGDGRNNQIQLALWASRNQITPAGQIPEEVVIFCIEEPEAHLHPHQQRKLAKYLSSAADTQVLITTHSPQIAASFPPDSILRLRDSGSGTVAAGGGCSPEVAERLVEFGYRLSILPAETFFASAVLLVEGPSEVLFYKALATAIDIDIDRFNISILSVEGVGFGTYARVLAALEIPFVVRTDNDVIAIPNADTFRFAGIQRGVNLLREFRPASEYARITEQTLGHLSGFTSQPIPEEHVEAATECRRVLVENAIFVGDVDLETDLVAELGEVMQAATGTNSPEAAIKQMRNRKATFMFDFLLAYSAELAALSAGQLAHPLWQARAFVAGM